MRALPKSRLRKLILPTILLALAACALLLYFRNSLAIPIIRYLSQAVGVNLTQIDGLIIDADSLNAESIVGSYSNESFLSDFSLSNTIVTYLALSSVDSPLKVEHVTIENADVTFQRNTQIASNKIERLANPPSIPPIDVSSLTLTLPDWQLPGIVFRSAKLRTIGNNISIYADLADFPVEKFKPLLNPLHLDAASGSVKGTVNCNFVNTDFVLSSHLQFEQIAGGIYGYPFSGLRSQLQLAYKKSLSIDLDADLDSFPEPVAAKSIKLKARLRDSKVTAAASFSIFDGSMSAPEITASSDGVQTFAIQGRNLDLSEIINAYAPQSVSATGRFRLDATVHPTAPLPSLAGSFASETTGSLKVAPERLPLASTSQTDLVRRALQDFRFSSIRGSLNSTADGTLTINAAIEGASPLVDNARPIHLNLKVEENLPQLIESLRLLGQLPQSFDKALDSK